MTYFPGELTGMHSMVNYLERNWKKDANGKVDINLELWCDDESVLKVINPKVKSTFVAVCKPEGALVHQTWGMLQHMRRVALNHVKGHQDDSTPYKKLRLPARLNVDCDTLAKRKM